MLRSSMIRSGSLLFALLLAAPALAQDEDESFSREGPYLGFDALLAIENSADSLDVSETGGLAGRIGFRLTPEFALELEGEWAHLDGRNPWSLSIVSKLYPTPWFLDGQAGFFDDRLQPYFVSSAGIIVGELGRGQEPASSFRIGSGADFWLNSDLALTGQFVYVANAGDATDYDSVNLRLGVTWRY